MDFAHFAYLRQRLNASILAYVDDAGISASMIWESYPVIRMLLGWVAVFAGIFFVTRYLFQFAGKDPVAVRRRGRIISYTLGFLVLGLAIFGRVGQFPLRWSDAFSLDSDFNANLALNPFQSFSSSLKFRKQGCDIKAAREYYPLMSEMLGVERPDTASLRFDRRLPVDSSGIPGVRNVVLVICESFSGYKSSMWGNPLNTTPYFQELCKEGLFFKNCFSPAYGTARGVWAIVTGIPDVTEYKTASRNPNLVDQESVMDQFRGFEKFYFIGGSASCANIRGLLKNNIHGLHLYEQDDYHAGKLNVWGISDKNLFLEANDVLRRQEKPFFAIIQTADNHRPYTIPAEDRSSIVMRDLPKDSLEKCGFYSNAELNAYAYMDYTYRVFMEAAKKESYFNNTVFVFVGDHGIRGSAGSMMPKVWTDQGLTVQHVPLLFYAPGLVHPAEVDRKVSQLDIMPTLAGILRQPVVNTTMGRNILTDLQPPDSDIRRNHAFTVDFDKRLIGLVCGNYYYEYDLKTNKDGVYPVKDNVPLPPGQPTPGDRELMRRLTLGYYETARYLLYHNKKIRDQAPGEALSSSRK